MLLCYAEEANQPEVAPVEEAPQATTDKATGKAKGGKGKGRGKQASKVRSGRLRMQGKGRKGNASQKIAACIEGRVQNLKSARPSPGAQAKMRSWSIRREVGMLWVALESWEEGELNQTSMNLHIARHGQVATTRLIGYMGKWLQPV